MSRSFFTFLIFCLISLQAEPSGDIPFQKIDKAIAAYDYDSAIALIDSVLVQPDTIHKEDVRNLSLMKARCQKKLFRFGDASRTLGVIASEEDIEVMGELADCYANDGKMENASLLYNVLMAKQPSNIFFRLQLLNILNKSSDWNGCIDHGKALLQLDSLPQAHSIVGHAYSKLGQVDSALVHYGRALEKKPDSPGYLSSVCNLLLSKEEYGNVIGMTAHYLNTYTPDEPEIESIYGFASYQIKNYEEAYKAFGKLKEDGDKSYSTFYYSGLSSLALEKFKEAAEDFGAAWQIDSSSAMLAANFATALSRSYRQEEAMRMFGKAEELMKPNPAVEFKVAYGKAYSFYVQGKYAEAIPFYKRAYELDGSYISAISTIGYCYEMLKEYASAKKWYEKYLSVGRPGTKAYDFVKESLTYVNSELFMEDSLE